MELYLTDEHRELREDVAAFARENVVPVARDLDEESRFPWENVKAMGDRGYLGVPVPRSYGGMGRDYLSYIVVVEELARYDASHAITVSAHTTLGTMPILDFGTEEQKRRWVPRLASGSVLGGFGLTEPGAGSDASRSRTRAVREDGGWRLDGSKLFITHAGVGEIFTVTAATDPDGESSEITSFVVTKPTADLEIADRLGTGHDPSLEFVDGVRAGRKEDKMGWRASDTRELLLDGAWVSDENRIGGVGEGFSNFMKTLDSGRIGLAALSVGLARGAVDVALRYSREREQFGRKLWEFQPVRFRLAELETDIEAGRHLTYHAARLKQNDRPYKKQAAMAKLFCSELAMRATRQAVQVMGAAGYTDEHPVERMMRDAKVCEIGEGTSEIQKLVIGREMIRETFGEGAL